MSTVTYQQVDSKLAEALVMLEQFIWTEDPCEYDHHGYCQAHNLGSSPCSHARAKRLLISYDRWPNEDPVGEDFDYDSEEYIPG